jgi:CheY-like chemotaxis protein
MCPASAAAASARWQRSSRASPDQLARLAACEYDGGMGTGDARPEDQDRRRNIRRRFNVFAAWDIARELQERRRSSRRRAEQAEHDRSVDPGHDHSAVDASPDLTRPTVLVVDDVDGTRVGLSQLLTLRGYNALQATDGAVGIQVLQQSPQVRAIVLDLRMADFDGFWFRERQLATPALAKIPVIVFTGADVPNDVKARLGVSDVLMKPVSIDQLFETIGRHCETSARDSA